MEYVGNDKFALYLMRYTGEWVGIHDGMSIADALQKNVGETRQSGHNIIFASIQRMVDVTIDELIATAAVKKQGFGGLWHIINHTAAITELDRFGYKEVAQRALPAHHQHVRLWRSLPDVESELGLVVKAEHNPRDPAYWTGMLKRDEARLTHRIKTLYGFRTIMRFIEDDHTQKDAEDAFLYLMA